MLRACPEISSPPLKARPVPVNTNTRALLSMVAWVTVSIRSRLMAWVMPFMRSGVLKAIQTMPGSRSSTVKPVNVPVRSMLRPRVV